MTKEQLIEKAIDESALCDYLCADFGESIAVYADGNYAVGESVGYEIAEDERPVVLVKCPGIWNLDSGEWTQDFEESGDGEWISEDGRRLSLEDCIRICCEDGDVSDEVEHLRQRLLEKLWDEESANCERHCAGEAEV